jgi:alpha-beta hydrolase superfamily lysophospholipase
VVDDVVRVVARIEELHPSASVCALGISLGAAMLLATSLLHPDCFQRQAALSPGLAPTLQIRCAAHRPRVPGLRAAALRCTSCRTRWSSSAIARTCVGAVGDPLRTRASPRASCRGLPHAALRAPRHLPAARPVLALVAEKDSMVDNEVVLETLNRVRATPVRVEIFEGAHHVLPASVPLEELVGRAITGSPRRGRARPRVSVQRVPPRPRRRPSRRRA